MSTAEMIQIPSTQFIGEGQYPWLITGRIPGDEDDSVRLVLGDDLESAQKFFRSDLMAKAKLSEDEMEGISEQYGSDIIGTNALKLA